MHTQSVAQPQSARNDAVCSHRDGRRDDRAQRVSQTEKHRACGVTCAESTVNDTSDPIYKTHTDSETEKKVTAAKGESRGGGTRGVWGYNAHSAVYKINSSSSCTAQGTMFSMLR